jgi:hypothetical protein
MFHKYDLHRNKFCIEYEGFLFLRMTPNDVSHVAWDIRQLSYVPDVANFGFNTVSYVWRKQSEFKNVYNCKSILMHFLFSAQNGTEHTWSVLVSWYPRLVKQTGDKYNFRNILCKYYYFIQDVAKKTKAKSYK